MTLFKNWPQPICPSVSDKLGYNGTFFKDKKNEISSHKKTWTNLKGILLTERSQSGNTAHHMIPII